MELGPGRLELAPHTDRRVSGVVARIRLISLMLSRLARLAPRLLLVRP